MNLETQNILFFSRTMGMGGTSNVMIQMCKILKPRVNKIIVCSTGGPMVEALESMGIKHIIINDVGKHRITDLFRILKQVSRIITIEKITVIHTHHRMAAFYSSILRIKHKFIFINTSHNTFYNNKLITKFAYKNANLIACGEMVKKNLVEYFGIPNSRITVIHNAVEAFDGNIKPVQKLQIMKNKGYYLVGNVGRFAEQKGMEYFISSYPIIKKQTNMIKYVLIGDGVDKEKLKNQIQDLEIQDDVIFLGFRRDVQNVLSQIDLLVLSSLWEGFPLTPIEGFSVGKTIVATEVDGTVEIVKNNENGFLIQSKNPMQIAERVMYFYKHPDVQKKFEQEAYKIFEMNFSFESFSEKIINYYMNC